MDIEILEMAERKCKFILKNSTPAMANALRRTMLSDIPKMAIDKVEFHLGPIDVNGKEFESITPLFDEIIAHRLGMVPVPTDLNTFTFQDKCVCGGEGCPNCTPDLRVKDEEIPIVELADGQSVLIYAHAVMGTARQHVKWQVANGVGYKYMPTLEIVKDVSEPSLVIEKCPKHVFAMEDGKLVIRNLIDCITCRKCEEVSNGEIKVGAVDTDFVFKFETDGSLTAEQVLSKAAEVLSQNAKEFAEKVAAF